MFKILSGWHVSACQSREVTSLKQPLAKQQRGHSHKHNHIQKQVLQAKCANSLKEEKKEVH